MDQKGGDSLVMSVRILEMTVTSLGHNILGPVVSSCDGPSGLAYVVVDTEKALASWSRPTKPNERAW